MLSKKKKKSAHVCNEAQNLFYVLFLHLANWVSLSKRELTIPKVPTTVLIKKQEKEREKLHKYLHSPV